ncbi:MAG: Ada metal-binding domain-containing protein [Candidatus Anammoxibacter sp.]
MKNKTYTIETETRTFETEIFGGHRKLKIYGRLDCPNAKRWIAKGYYTAQRVFFANETKAIGAGYRPCGCCMKQEYKEWKKTG